MSVAPTPELDELDRAIAVLAAVDLDSLTDDEVAAEVRRLEQAARRLSSVCSSRLAAFQARLVHAADGERSAVTWMARECGTDRRESARELRRARTLRLMPLVAAAFAEGKISVSHVDALARAQRFAPELFARDEAVLLGHAIELVHADFVRALAYWRQLADPDGVEDQAEGLAERRNLYASPTVDEAVVINGLLDPVQGAVFLAEVERLERTFFEADWAEAKQRLGAGVRSADLARTSAQRRADALVMMAKRSAAAPPGARLPRPLVTVLIDYPTLHGRVCELSNGTVITPGQVLPLLAEADVERVVFDGPSRVLDVGETRRFFRGATRRAVEVRDGCCTTVGCDVPAERCDVDHIEPHPEGPTVQDNGRLRCPDHHTNRRRPLTPPADDPP